MRSKHRDSAYDVSVFTSYTQIVYINPFKMIFYRLKFIFRDVLSFKCGFFLQI